MMALVWRTDSAILTSHVNELDEIQDGSVDIGGTSRRVMIIRR